jgi:hypothetical protein
MVLKLNLDNNMLTDLLHKWTLLNNKIDWMGITHFVKNNLFKIHKDDWKICGWSLCQNYPWHFLLMAYKTPMPVGRPPEVLGDERMDWNESDLKSVMGWFGVRLG